MACNSTCTSACGTRGSCRMIAPDRTPFYEHWQLDLLRVKGGIADYCVIGEIDEHVLRQFHRGHRLPVKLVRDRFEIDFGRNVLPAGEMQ